MTHANPEYLRFIRDAAEADAVNDYNVGETAIPDPDDAWARSGLGDPDDGGVGQRAYLDTYLDVWFREARYAAGTRHE